MHLHAREIADARDLVSAGYHRRGDGLGWGAAVRRRLRVWRLPRLAPRV